MTNNIYFLLAIFLLLSGLDLLTTWLDLFKLPDDMRGQEMNPVFGDIRTHWRHNVAWKLIATFLIALAAWKRNDVFPVLMINITLFLVVMNNFYIYITRRYWHRKTVTIGSFMAQLCKAAHLPKQVAYFATVLVLGGISWGLALLVK